MYDGDISCIVYTEWSDRSILKNIDLILGLYTIYRPHHIKGMMSPSYYIDSLNPWESNHRDTPMGHKKNTICTVLYCTYYTVLYILYSTVHIVLYCTICTVLYNMYFVYLLYGIVLCTYCIVLYCTYCIVLYCTYCTVLYNMYSTV